MSKFLSLLVLFSVSSLAVAQSCLDEASLKALDLQYEEALRSGNAEFIQNLLLEDFVWIHNHAVSAETKAQLVARLGEDHQPPLARASDKVDVRRAGLTAVITGFTTVEKADADGGNRRASRYHFMRTYVAEAGADMAEHDRCRLLAGQTMKVWSSEGDPL